MNKLHENEGVSRSDVIPSRPFRSLCDFRFKRVLGENPERKFVSIEGTIKNGSDPAVIVLEKEVFEHKNLPLVLQDESSIEINADNDIYYSCRYLPTSIFNGGLYCFHKFHKILSIIILNLILKVTRFLEIHFVIT